MNTSEATVLSLRAETAADLMSPDPISVRDTATLREAVALLTGKGFAAAPVIDAAGRPVGVLSRSDLLIHEGQRAEKPADPNRAGRTLVRDVMTPVVFSVTPATPARRVVEDLVSLHVHRLFVVDPGGALVGVISAADVLRRLR